MVIDVGCRFFPTVSQGWSDSRVTVVKQDASKYIQQDHLKSTFDVVRLILAIAIPIPCWRTLIALDHL